MANAPILVELLPILDDNYAFMLRQEGNSRVVIVDPGEAAPIAEALAERSLQIGSILITHSHADHVAGVEELALATQVEVIGNGADCHRLPKLTRTVEPGQRFELLGTPVEVLDTPGHVRGHVSYHLPEAKLLFCGDVMFTMGCGRLGEDGPEVLWKSLQLLAGLPDDTKVYSGHEYTLGNAKFAAHVFPDNQEIKARLAKVQELRAAGQPTVPTTIGEEKRTNPFLLGGSEARFAELREAKNNFRG
ncbi:hydroxyacylglutathione hydrolase [Geminicoccus flavidas]|uniref:hydroxyacylglutathione hydrolase n=1 Tax=Geminicoccus flavidas TaxID=2506407 RepID=UPI001F38FEB0|nr:hydroxyacylglutathione hydrolase [Geminicoccus flavidas]